LLRNIVRGRVARLTGIAVIAVAATATGMTVTHAATDAATPQIVGGQPATQQYPFVGAVSRDDEGTDGQYPLCGAALVAPQWAVTAAHCNELDGTPPIQHIHIRFGTPDRTHGGIEVGVDRRVGFGFDQNPTGRDPVRDVALLHVDRPVPYIPAWIPPGPESAGTPVRLVGWGSTQPDGHGRAAQTLRQLDSHLAPHESCAAAGIGPDELCVSNADGWRGACFGDSGSPLLHHGPLGWEIVGDTSRGMNDSGTQPCGTPAIYADVTQYRDAIYSTILGLPLGSHPNATQITAARAGRP
jgi:Trypsin